MESANSIDSYQSWEDSFSHEVPGTRQPDNAAHSPGLKRLLSGNSIPSFVLSSSMMFSLGSAVTHLMFRNCDTSGLNYGSTAFKVAVSLAGAGAVLCGIDLFIRCSGPDWLYTQPEYLIAEEADLHVMVVDGDEGNPLLEKNAPPCGPRLHGICKKYPNVIGTATGTVFGAGLFVLLLTLLLDSLCDMRKVAAGTPPMVIAVVSTLVSLAVLVGSVFSQCLRPPVQRLAEPNNRRDSVVRFRDSDGETFESHHTSTSDSISDDEKGTTVQMHTPKHLTRKNPRAIG